MPLRTDKQKPRISVAILAKAPIPGLAKTRLIPHLGADGAAALQRWLLQRVVATAVAADIGPISLWCTPEVDHPEFSACRAFGALELRRQPEGDLGERMYAAVAAATTSAGTLVIGTDCPVLTPKLLQQAADSLLHHDATIVPAEDGGYVLIGMRKARRQAFLNVDWSTDRVTVQTRTCLDAIGWKCSEFPPLWDVDRREDFVRLAILFPEVSAFACNARAMS